MRRWTLSLGMGSALVACLAIGVAGSARAATLDFTGTLAINIFGWRDLAGEGRLSDRTRRGIGAGDRRRQSAPALVHAARWHLRPLDRHTLCPADLRYRLRSLRFTLAQNLSGSFSGISGGPPGGGPMGLSGIAKICWLFAARLRRLRPASSHPDCRGSRLRHRRDANRHRRRDGHHAARPVDDRPAGDDAPHAEQHDHDAGAPGRLRPRPGLAHIEHRPALGRPATRDGEQGLHEPYGAFPEVPLTAVLTLHFVPEPGTLLLLGLGVAGLAAYGRRRRGR